MTGADASVSLPNAVLKTSGMSSNKIPALPVYRGYSYGKITGCDKIACGRQTDSEGNL